MVTEKRKKSYYPVISFPKKDPIELKGNGSTILFSFKELEDKIKYLRSVDYMNLNKLDDYTNECYHYVISKVAVFYDTDSYDILIDLIKKYFLDVEKIKTNTIGSYCYGCISQVGKKFSQLDCLCTPICAHSIKSDSSSRSCSNSVILAIYNNDAQEYDFKNISLAHTEEGSSKVYLHLNIPKLDYFNGFSKDERKRLRLMGITYVSLIGKVREYDEDGNVYEKYIIMTDMTLLSECKKRSFRDKFSPSSYTTSNKGNTAFLFLFLFVIIIIIAFFIIRSQRTQRIRVNRY